MMKFIKTIAIATLLSAGAEAIVLEERTDAPARVLELAIQRRVVTNPLASDRLRRRAKTVSVSLENVQQSLYYANVTIGTPPQSLMLQIDTGSSDLWVNSPQSSLCQDISSPCSDSGTYKANSSSTYSYISSRFTIVYVDNSGASGDYVSDKVAIGGVTMNDVQFAIGYESTSVASLLGIGYQTDEAQTDQPGHKTYDNLPAKMVADGLIPSNAYSLYLNDLEASTGTVIFGGVDTDHYEGTLATLPINPENGIYRSLSITLTAVSIDRKSIADSQKVSACLDSGTTLTYLPNAMAHAIIQAVGAKYDIEQGVAYLPCSKAKTSSAVDYTFTSSTISVPMSELVLEADSDHRLNTTHGTKSCIFGIVPADSGDVLLGDSFLRSAYVVYDLANNEISIAQAKFNVTSSNVLQIGTGPKAVPSATPVANPVIVSGTSYGLVAPTGAIGHSGAAEALAPLAAVVALAASVLFGVM